MGKTSLVSRFVSDTFSEKYLTTVGVKIEERQLSVDGQDMTLVVWDLHGDDVYQRVKASYLRGMAGYFVVIDGTRPKTLEVALELSEKLSKELENVPGIALLNKSDLKEQWDLDPEMLESLSSLGLETYETSAKTGEMVEVAFQKIAEAILCPK